MVGHGSTTMEGYGSTTMVGHDSTTMVGYEETCIHVCSNSSCHPTFELKSQTAVAIKDCKIHVMAGAQVVFGSPAVETKGAQ
jgi:hypothetical protein